MEKLTDKADEDDDDDAVWNGMGMGHQERREVPCVCATLVVETLESLVKAWQSPTRKLVATRADKADRNIILFCTDDKEYGSLQSKVCSWCDPVSFSQCGFPEYLVC
jgi:hypothetical protein